MSDKRNTAVLDELLDPVADCFTPEVASRVASLRASPQLQARLDALADKCTDGALTAEERDLYEASVRALNFIGVLQAKARRVLARQSTSS